MSGPALAAVLAASAVALGACGGGDKEPARAGTPTATPTAEESARAPADAGGSATYCVGRGSRYSERQAVDAFNAAQGADGVHVRRRSTPTSTPP